ncbi:dTDP-4-dehydrorhamnose reductase [Gilliamella sp. Pra-s65]|uniref:dTDP-4-dehydrorhamnose reductase n=1 Tax=unclassified Gilliamella TaxID=2685620 RepID=UPI00136635D1|nr:MULTISPECIES: dTDP-4-dehydrorhamnose reductase [unclassified Gilliamella]MWN91028.1 dTDP-4-dehydrorhamnose reductase [Gilliamella sp. Pra-s65]MWP46393.1 dTDP-4-dehydrorhamnose reductase [Gilliamella sp. Pas-s27]MWP73864.1 dTDP-4-dehydrorhamnose reductase [Gilliamella sp. Pra-s52]
MKVLLTGANGQLGKCFKDIYPTDWQLLITSSQQLDITDKLAVDNFIAEHRPDVIVNAAAYTAVDKAEDEYELAYRVNALGPKNLAIAAQKYHAKLVHVSTDYVFDGTKSSPYLEGDLTNPINVYGETKRAGELFVLDNYSSTIVIRTSWVFSEYGNNFVKTMLKLAGEKSELSVIDDQIGNPTYAGDIAKVIIQLIEINADGGIYHYCGDESTSWFLFAKNIFDIALDQNLLFQIPVVSPINSQSFPSKAKRPLYSAMSMDKIKKYHLSGSNWKEKLISCISKIKSI